ncbi:MAG: gamma-glutamyltransferase [Anaerolineae bacterium]|nr:gamma-glutamyltransferase [Anaerolineae bacterium]
MRGIIAAGSPYSAEAGAEMLRRGGNAVDAVVAATFASFMAEPSISAPGGGGFALLTGPGREPVIYDFFCATPGLGSGTAPDPAALDFLPVEVIYENSIGIYHIGRGSTAVPGNIAGLALMLEEGGTLPLGVVLEPAIRYARDGLTVTPVQAYIHRLIESLLRYDPRCWALFERGGRLIQAGERYANPALADTLERLARDGAATFYTGALADAILAEQRPTDSRRGGLLTAEDLAAYRVIKRAPLRFAYKGYTVYTNPPPSAGGMLIAYGMRLFEHADLAGLTHGGTEHVALLAEIMRQTEVARHRDQPHTLPDPAAWDAYLCDSCLDDDWEAVVRAFADGPAPAPSGPGGPSSTTHISVIDSTGLAVGMTTTPGETAGYVVGDTGLLMNNILGEADLNPGGFFRFAPGVRLASMMAPTIVTDESGPRLVVGSGGSNRLRGAIFQALSNVLDWRLPIAAAVSQPRVHWEDGVLNLEGGYDPAAADALAARGYTVERWPGLNFYFGGTHAVYRAEDAGSGDALRGAGDSRRDGAVVVE